MEYLYFKLYEDNNLYCITFWILCYAVIISFTLPLRLWSIQSVRDIHGQKTKFEARTEESLVTSFCEPDFQLEITLLPIGQKSDQPYIEIEKLLECCSVGI